MSGFDLILLVILLFYAWGGFWTGLIQSIGGVVGLLVGVVVASRFAGAFGDVLTPTFGGQAIFADLTAFAILFLLVGRLVGLAFVLVNRLFNFIAIIPGMKMMNRLSGALFGLIEGSLYLGVLLQFAVRLPLGPGLRETLQDSVLVPVLLGMAAWLTGLFPKALRETENLLDRVTSR